MIERRALPVRRRMARAAVLRETDRGMVRVVGLVEIGEVTGNALRAQRSELSVRVALAARDRGVGARQRELGSGVIERGARPLLRRMALRAVLWEAGRHVIRIVRGLECRLVAAKTV